MKKVQKKTGHPPYTYATLSELNSKEHVQANLYGVVLDCTSPYFIEKTCKYLCLFKVIDETLTDYFSVSLFAKTMEELPRVPKIGSILRLHRGKTHIFHEKMQFTCDISIKGAWALFDPFMSDFAIAHTGKTYTFTRDDSERINSLRKFGQKYFEENEVKGGTLLAVAEKEKPEDFDALCLVLNTKRVVGPDNEVNIKLTLCDKTKAVKLRVAEDRYNHIKKLDVVRVRSANYDQTFQNLTLHEHSNLLILPPNYKSAKNLLSELQSENASKEVKTLMNLHWPKPLSPCQILSDHGTKDPVKLREIFSKSATEKFYKIKVKVVETIPSIPLEWVCVFDRKAQKAVPRDEMKEKLPEGYEYYYKFQLIVQDELCEGDSNLYKLYLCTLEGKGKEFIGLEKDYMNTKKLKQLHKLMTRPWVVLDLIIESLAPSLFLIVDTKLEY